MQNAWGLRVEAFSCHWSFLSALCPPARRSSPAPPPFISALTFKDHPLTHYLNFRVYFLLWTSLGRPFALFAGRLFSVAFLHLWWMHSQICSLLGCLFASPVAPCLYKQYRLQKMLLVGEHYFSPLRKRWEWGVSWWLSELKTWHCHGCVSVSISDPGTCTCQGHN